MLGLLFSVTLSEYDDLGDDRGSVLGISVGGGYELMDRNLHSKPFRANSIFLAVSPSLKPPLLAQTIEPSPSSTFSSTAACGHGQ